MRTLARTAYTDALKKLFIYAEVSDEARIKAAEKRQRNDAERIEHATILHNSVCERLNTIPGSDFKPALFTTLTQDVIQALSYALELDSFQKNNIYSLFISLDLLLRITYVYQVSTPHLNYRSIECCIDNVNQLLNDSTKLSDPIKQSLAFETELERQIANSLLDASKLSRLHLEEYLGFAQKLKNLEEHIRQLCGFAQRSPTAKLFRLKSASEEELKQAIRRIPPTSEQPTRKRPRSVTLEDPLTVEEEKAQRYQTNIKRAKKAVADTVSTRPNLFAPSSQKVTEAALALVQLQNGLPTEVMYTRPFGQS